MVLVTFDPVASLGRVENIDKVVHDLPEDWAVRWIDAPHKVGAELEKIAQGGKYIEQIL